MTWRETILTIFPYTPSIDRCDLVEVNQQEWSRDDLNDNETPVYFHDVLIIFNESERDEDEYENVYQFDLIDMMDCEYQGSNFSIDNNEPWKIGKIVETINSTIIFIFPILNNTDMNKIQIFISTYTRIECISIKIDWIFSRIKKKILFINHW